MGKIKEKSLDILKIIAFVIFWLLLLHGCGKPKPTYDDGYQEGYAKGEESGYDWGYDDGYNDGYAAALSDYDIEDEE